MKPSRLQLLVMHVASRCDQACGHCSVWKANGRSTNQLSAAERVALIEEAHGLGARSILFTGGEPLLCDHLDSLARAAHQLGFRVQIATNGLGLARAAAWVSDLVDEVYISIEGPAEIHDSIRGQGSFSRLGASVCSLTMSKKRPRLIGRSVISNRNIRLLEMTTSSARALGLDRLSFLPIDLTSQAFGGDPAYRQTLAPSLEDVAAFRNSVSRMKASGDLGQFIVEDERKLLAIADGLARDTASRRAPRCDAPEWSSVVETDGAVRPCFFQPVVQPARFAGRAVALAAVRLSAEYAQALDRLGDGDATCAACACPKYLAGSRPSLARRLAAAFDWRERTASDADGRVA